MKRKHLYLVAGLIWGIPGIIISLFMMGLGIALKHIPGIPPTFTASFYSGLGPMLILSSVRFMSYRKNAD